MKRRRIPAVLAILSAAVCAVSLPSGVRADWLTYHHDPTRGGNDTSEPSLVHPGFAWAHGVDQNVFGTPVVIGNIVVVATENDTLYGMDINSGGQVWATHVGTPVTSGLPCGDINPLGITGTPVIDPTSRIVWAVAEEAGNPPSHHLVGLSVDNGNVLHDTVIDPGGQDPNVEQQRPALALANGYVYVGFGGLDGDCGNYHGYVVAASASTGQPVAQFEVAPQCSQFGGGIWGTSGPALDGAGNVFVATGNSCQHVNGTYDHSDGVLRFAAPLTLTDYFAPAGWFNDNNADLDLGSIGPVLISGGLLFQTGKTGVGYVLSQSSLGGIGGQRTSAQVCPGGAFGGNAYDSATGIVYVPCTNGINAWHVGAGGALSHVWGPTSNSNTPPILAGGLLWAANLPAGALYGLDPATGGVVDALPLGVATSYVHFASLSASGAHLLVGAGSRVVSYTVSAPARPKEVTIARRSDGNTDIFVRGVDGAGWHAAGDAHGNPINPWETLGGQVIGAPAGTWFGGELDVFALGLDHQPWLKRWTPSGWTGWSLVAGGGQAFGAPSEEVTSTRRADGSIDLFLRGVDSAGWHAVTDQHGSLVLSWESLGGGLRGDPDATWSGGTLLVFAVGLDHGLWRDTFTSSWNGWGAIGGSSATLTSDHVTVAVRADGTMDLFVLGSDRAIWHAPAAASGTPTFWESLGGLLLGPAWASWGAQSQLDIVAIGIDSRPYGREYAAGWANWRLLPGQGVSG